MKFVRGLFVAIVAAGMLLAPSITKADLALGINFSFPSWNAGLHARVDRVFLTTSYFFDGGAVGASVDFIVWNPKFNDNFAFYAAPGVFATFTDPFVFGVELPIGIVWTGVPSLEVYIQGIPAVPVTPDVDFDIGGSAGFRIVL